MPQVRHTKGDDTFGLPIIAAKNTVRGNSPASDQLLINSEIRADTLRTHHGGCAGIGRSMHAIRT